MSSPRSWRAAAVALPLVALSFLGSATTVQAETYLGVQLQELSDALMEAMDLDAGQAGVLVAEIVDDGPAAEAGLRRGDVILALAGTGVSNVRDLRRAIRRGEPGDRIEVEVLRRGRRQTLSVTLGESQVLRGDGEDARVFRRPGQRAPRSRDRLVFRGRPHLGVRVEELDEQLGHAFGRESGLLVLAVIEDSAAERGDIQRGDVIVQVAGQDVSDVEGLGDILRELEDENDTIGVLVLRRGNEQELSVDVESGEMAWFDAPTMRRFRRPEIRSWSWDHDDSRSHHRGSRREGRLEGDLEELRRELDELRERLEELRSREDG